MRVGLGVTALLRGLFSSEVDGIGQTSLELNRELHRLPGMKIIPISFGHPGFEKLDGGSGLLLSRFAPLAASSALTGLPFLGNKKLNGKIDIFHSTDHYIPNLCKIPVVATIHDAIPIAHPEWVSIKYSLMISHLFKQSSKWATKIITISDYSKNMISYYFNISPERIVVIPNGVGTRWFEQVDRKLLNTLRYKYNLSRRYAICVGTLQPRKNIVRLIEAFKMLPISLRGEVSLVIVGRAGWGSGETLKAINCGIDDGCVRWLKYLPDNELTALVKGATCLAFPSLAEGFGLPVVEAFAAGVPVVTSNISSLPEVAGDAALLIDPLNTEEISYALYSLFEDSDLSNSLRIKGLNRAKDYSWEKTAHEVRSVYRSIT